MEQPTGSLVLVCYGSASVSVATADHVVVVVAVVVAIAVNVGPVFDQARCIGLRW